ncbi:MAG TPA: ABC transporter substrate-binding protein [Bradyrhizobium sp.]|nr:ABC transporter substrate-binding protein [Bradyrhizobium sp.]
MKRREFITLLGGAAVAWPLAAQAQQRGGVLRVGVLMGRAADDAEGQKQTAALEQGLLELGWTPHKNIEVDYRWAAGDTALARTLARELVDPRPDLLVVNSTASLVAVSQQTQSIPVVFVAITDPVAQGFVQSLARPGGNITGFGAEELSMGSKWLELLKEVAPNVTSFTVIFNPDSAPFARMYLPFIETARRACSCELTVSPVHNEREIDSAVAAAGQRSGSGLIALPDSFLNSHRERIAASVAGQHLPAIYSVTEFVRSGGLIAYGIDRADVFRRAATYVDRILKGANPADLPVQQPTKFELAINLKTARALGLSISPTLLSRADEVIE